MQMIAAIILIVLLYHTVQYKNKRMEAILVQMSDKQANPELREMSFWDEGIPMLFMLGIIGFFAWGAFSCFLGYQTNSKLAKIKADGTRVTAQVVSCEINSEYSTASSPVYTYFVDFKIAGEEKRSATKSLVYSPVNSKIDIYYLKGHGCAIADVTEFPGDIKFRQGALGILAALFLIYIRLRVKHRMHRKKVFRMIRNTLTEASVQEELRKENRIQVFVTIALCILGIVSISLGYRENLMLSRIKEHGTRTTATVVKCNAKVDYFTGEYSEQYDCSVEFTVNGEKTIGHAITGKTFLRGDNTDIYYIINENKGIMDVAIADVDDKPGTDKIVYGIFELLFAFAILVDLLGFPNISTHE